GVLTGKYRPGDAPPSGSRATDPSGSSFIEGYLTDDILRRVQQLSPVADEAGLSLAQLAVAWVLQNPNVSAAIVGATRPEQVRENVRASGVRLDSGLMRRIDEILGPGIERDPARTASPARRDCPPPGLSPPGAGSSGRIRRGPLPAASPGPRPLPAARASSRRARSPRRSGCRRSTSAGPAPWPVSRPSYRTTTSRSCRLTLLPSPERTSPP